MSGHRIGFAGSLLLHCGLLGIGWALADIPRPSAAPTSSMPICRVASAFGSSWARTANFCEPNTDTCATPLTMDIRWAIMVSAYSSTV